MKRLLVPILLVWCCAGAAHPQQTQSRYPSVVYLGPACPLTLNDIIKMSQAGVRDDTTIAELRKCDQHFQLSKNDLARLKNGGVSQNLIEAMIQPPSGVDDVIKLVQAGVNEDIIMEEVSKRHFELTANDLIRLKKAGVSDRVVQAMIDPTKPVASSPVQKANTASQVTALQPPTHQVALQSSPVQPAQNGDPSPTPAPADVAASATSFAPNSSQPLVAATPPTDGPRVYFSSASTGNDWNAARNQSMEMSKDFEKDCPGVRITINMSAADYTIMLNHIEHGFVRDNQVQIANRDGDLISRTKEGGSIRGDMKKACQILLADWSKSKSR